MARTVFRVLIGLTLFVMIIARYSRGRLPVMLFLPFHWWFVASVFIFAVFGLIAAYHAFREPHNRRAYLFDVILAAAWVPYWFANLS
jgi:purine-cytosine permease-like protein